MPRCPQTISTVVATFTTAAAHASLANIVVVADDSIVPGHTTYQLYATFSDPTIRLLSVGADPDIAAFAYVPIAGDTTLYNDAGPLTGLGFDDLVGGYTGPGDSYVDIGPLPGSAMFTPGFLGWSGHGGGSILSGDALFEDELGGWFKTDTSNPSISDSYFAQLTIADGAVASLSGTLTHGSGGVLTSEAFGVVIPAGPAYAMLLTIAFGSRRRRG